MTTHEEKELRRWTAEVLMGWHTKGDAPTCYYYDDKGHRTGTIRNWRPEWELSGEIWMVVSRMRKLGWWCEIGHTAIIEQGKIWKAAFKKLQNLPSFQQNSGYATADNPCLAILRAARLALESNPGS